MKRSRKQRSGCRFSLVLVLLLTAAAWVVSVSAAGEPGDQKSGQTVIRALPAAPSAQWVAGTQKSQPLQAGTSAPPAGHVVITAKGLPAGTAAGKPASEAKETPEELSAIVKKTSAFLSAPRFTFLPDKGLDPFVPFVSLQNNNGSGGPGAGGPLTPLQKMTLAEMERGLKAIVWGGLGKMAVIEDSTGKGYIVGVGTPAGPNGGVITQILDNSLVIQQEIWNSQTRKRLPEDFTVKMVKKDDETL